MVRETDIDVYSQFSRPLRCNIFVCSRNDKIGRTHKPLLDLNSLAPDTSGHVEQNEPDQFDDSFLLILRYDETTQPCIQVRILAEPFLGDSNRFSLHHLRNSNLSDYLKSLTANEV